MRPPSRISQPVNSLHLAMIRPWPGRVRGRANEEARVGSAASRVTALKAKVEEEVRPVEEKCASTTSVGLAGMEKTAGTAMAVPPEVLPGAQRAPRVQEHRNDPEDRIARQGQAAPGNRIRRSL